MIATTPPGHPAPPAAAAPPQASWRSLAEQRFICRALQLFRFCPLARCNRMRDCRGEPQRCLATRGEVVPREARVVPEAMLRAARYNRVRPGEGDRWFRQDYRREAAAFNAWISALEARDVRRERYALLARLRRGAQRAGRAR
jgi:hypothetical protein